MPSRRGAAEVRAGSARALTDAVSLVSLIDHLGRGAQPWPVPLHHAAIIVVGPGAAGRRASAARVLAQLFDRDPGAVAVATPPAAEWPFLHPLVESRAWPSGPLVLWTPDLHDAFVNTQGNSTRLVTTQPAYVLQLWIDAMAARSGVTFVATADLPALQQHAPEALEARGPWGAVAFVEAEGDAHDPENADGSADENAALALLPTAFRSAHPGDRLAAAGRALDEARTPPRLLALASACMEVNDLDNAGTLLAEAVAAAPAWAAAQFEHGKYWLRRDDMRAASEAFGRASALLPTFASAAANWGATLGELDRPDEALAAFTRALAADPANAQAVNNVGVVTRELGRLAESEAAFRRVIALTPDLAFGHYNLGHTLFLQGRYQASLNAYTAGQQKDPARNPVQASRLAMARLATGDAAGALRELKGCTANLPRDYRRQLLGRHAYRGLGAALGGAGTPRLAHRRRLAGGGAGQAVVWRRSMDDRTHTVSASSTTRSRRPGWISHLLHDRGIRLAAGLAVVVAMPVAVLFYFQFQSINDLASTSAVVLRQLSQETADAAANDVEDTLKRPHIGVLLGGAAGPHRCARPRLDGPGVPTGAGAEPIRRGVLRVVGRRRRNRPTRMLVYNRDSLADDSGDLDRRFRDAPGVAAVILPRLPTAARTQARHRGVPGHDRRPPEVRAGAAALPQRRPRYVLELHRARGRRRGDPHACTCPR